MSFLNHSQIKTPGVYLSVDVSTPFDQGKEGTPLYDVVVISTADSDGSQFLFEIVASKESVPGLDPWFANAWGSDHIKDYPSRVYYGPIPEPVGLTFADALQSSLQAPPVQETEEQTSPFGTINWDAPALVKVPKLEGAPAIPTLTKV